MKKSDTSTQTLGTEFTQRVMKAAATAKRRNNARTRFIAAIKEPFSMKTIQFLRTAPGIAMSLIVITTGSVGAVAIHNWFNEDVTVTPKGSNEYSVDLSDCKGDLYPYVISKNTDRHNVIFKVTGSPHYSPDQLRNKLLGLCEANAVHELFSKQFPDARLQYDLNRTTSVSDAEIKYVLLPALVTQVDASSITVKYSSGAKGAYDMQRVFPVSSDAVIYNEGNRSSLTAIKTNDTVEIVAYAPGATLQNIDETHALAERSDAQIVGLFKTRYDPNTEDYSGLSNIEFIDQNK